MSKINEAEDDGEITAVALGKDDSYVIIRERGWEWDLKGHYGALSDNLKTSRSAPRVCSPESSKLALRSLTPCVIARGVEFLQYN